MKNFKAEVLRDPDEVLEKGASFGAKPTGLNLFEADR